MRDFIFMRLQNQSKYQHRVLRSSIYMTAFTEETGVSGESGYLIGRAENPAGRCPPED